MVFGIALHNQNARGGSLRIDGTKTATGLKPMGFAAIESRLKIVAHALLRAASALVPMPGVWTFWLFSPELSQHPGTVQRWLPEMAQA
jgi:hypothetical protein